MTEAMTAKPTRTDPKRSDDTAPERPLRAPRHPSERKPPLGSNPDGSTPGALQGDHYPLELDSDGYPELPAFLDRSRKPDVIEEAAA